MIIAATSSKDNREDYINEFISKEEYEECKKDIAEYPNRIVENFKKRLEEKNKGAEGNE